MNLQEAEKSLNCFAEQLTVQCKALNFAAEMATAAASTELAEQAQTTKDLSRGNLEELLRNALAFSIVVQKALAKDEEQALHAPMQLARVITASNRLVQATRQARALVESTEVKAASRKNTSLLEGLREFREKQARERAEAAAERERRKDPDKYN